MADIFMKQVYVEKI